MESIFCPDASLKLQPETWKSDWKLHSKSLGKEGSPEKQFDWQVLLPSTQSMSRWWARTSVFLNTELVHAECGWPDWKAWFKRGVKLWALLTWDLWVPWPPSDQLECSKSSLSIGFNSAAFSGLQAVSWTLTFLGAEGKTIGMCNQEEESLKTRKKDNQP